MAATEITILSNGPVQVEGDFELRDPNGKTFELGGKTTVYLCRSGLSQNNPRCDGAHQKGGFTDDGAARSL